MKKIAILLVACLIMATFTGCWNNRDLIKNHFIVAAGLDITDDDRMELTVQIVKASDIKGGQEGEGGGSKENAVWTVTTTGDTVFDAIRNTLTVANRKLFWTHNQIIVIGEDLAKRGIADILDFFERDHESNPMSDVIIAKGIKAKEVLNAKSKLEQIPALHITGIIESQVALGKFKRNRLIDLMRTINSWGHNPVIGTIYPAKEDKKYLKDFRIQGAAVFKKDRLVGYLTPQETRGFLFMDNEIKSCIINVPNPLDKKKTVGIEIIRSSGKKEAQVKKGKIMLSVQVDTEGSLGDQQGHGDLTKPENIKKLEKEAENAIKNEIIAAIEAGQKKYRSDFFGFGNILYKKYPNYWKQVRDVWDKRFSDIPVNVNVKFSLKRSGLINNSITVR